MAKPKLESMEIRPSKNGGHNVRHNYASKPVLTKGPMSGGMSLQGTPPDEFNFGPKDHQNLIQHIAGALALKGLAGQGKALAGGNTAAPATMGGNPNDESALG